MSRIKTCFDALLPQKKALIPFITAGDPSPELTVPLMHALVEAGANILELGVPFSDPMADGPVIQRASERALRHGISLRDVFGMVKAFRQSDTKTPVILMGYLNPIEVMGYENFADQAKAAGVDGALTVDLPPEEAATLVQCLAERDIAPVFLIAPTTTDERLKRISEVAQDFVYYVALKGVTGSSQLDTSTLKQRIEHIRQFTKLPIGVGFGIKDAASAAAVGAISDAVVIGSALVDRIAEFQQEPEQAIKEARSFIQEIRQAIV